MRRQYCNRVATEPSAAERRREGEQCHRREREQSPDSSAASLPIASPEAAGDQGKIIISDLVRAFARNQRGTIRAPFSTNASPISGISTAKDQSGEEIS